LTDAPSRSAVIQARLAVGLLFGLIVGGVLWYGITAESLGRLWSDILDRPGGPMTFRFISATGDGDYRCVARWRT
jgi:hypothetical protein